MNQALFILIPLALIAQTAEGQSLIDIYTKARFKVQAERIFDQYGTRARVIAPLVLPSSRDTISVWLASFDRETERPAADTVETPELRWRLIRKLERVWFRKQFRETLWAYVGSNKLTSLDTMFTKELRARLEARFGPPTQTLSEVDLSSEVKREEYIQFEYWFVLNDSIPLIVMDVNGPFERGLVVASDQVLRDQLSDIKHAFLDEITINDELAPFVDYYYHLEMGIWYQTGYDGENFFLKQIPRPNLARGRPVLNSINAQ